VHGHDEDVRSWLVEGDLAIDWDSFADGARGLVERGRDHVLRVKDLIGIGETEGPIAIHGVRAVFHWPVRLPTRPGRARRSSIVLIGRRASMHTILGLPTQVLFGQLTLGLINGAFYALLSLGLAVIFGLLNIVNFSHGALYMMGAFAGWILLTVLGIGYWWALLLAPVIVGLFGMAIERLMIARLYRLDPIYGLLLTFGLALIIQGVFRNLYGVSGLPYAIPQALTGARNLGFMVLPNYRAWVIVASLAVSLATWFTIEKTSLGATLRAATENPTMVSAFGINVPRLVTLTYGFGVGLAAFAGVLAAPIYSVNPNMGADVIIVVFAVVVIGGMGSILGSVITGFALGLCEGLTKVLYPQGSSTVIFVIMIAVLLVKPSGLFGRTA
jgi:branched-chain amino acid transport system permease protein